MTSSAAATHCRVLSCLKCLQQAAEPVGQHLNSALDCGDLALLKVHLAALVAYPSRDYVEYQVIAVAVDLKGCLRVLHLSMTVDAVHLGLVVRRSCSHLASLGRKLSAHCWALVTML